MGAHRSETPFPSTFSGVLGHIEKPPFSVSSQATLEEAGDSPHGTPPGEYAKLVPGAPHGHVLPEIIPQRKCVLHCEGKEQPLNGCR